MLRIVSAYLADLPQSRQGNGVQGVAVAGNVPSGTDAQGLLYFHESISPVRQPSRRLHNPSRGIGPEHFTRVARKIDRRDSTGPRFSSLISAMPSLERNARFRMNSGTAPYDRGSLDTIRNFQLGISSKPSLTSLSYSVTRSTDRR